MLAITLVIGILIGIILPHKSNTSQLPGIRPRNDKLSTIMNIIERNYVDSVNRDDLKQQFLPFLKSSIPIQCTYLQKILYVQMNHFRVILKG